MKNLTGMAIFARVVEERSFSAAARRLGLSKSMVSKEVTRLEQALGVRLLNRTTRKLSLTEIGAAFYEPCARILQEAHEAELLVGRLHAEPRGVLRLTAPVAFGTLHVAPALPEFLAQYPEVEVHLVMDDRELDLAQREADLAIRMRAPVQADLIQRKLFTAHYHMYAAKTYLKSHATPKSLEEIPDHNIIVYGETAAPEIRDINWLLEVFKKNAKPESKGHIIRINNITGILQAVEAGRQWKFTPGLLNERPVPVIVTLELTFILRQ